MLNCALQVVSKTSSISLNQWKGYFPFPQYSSEWLLWTFPFLPAFALFLESFWTQETCSASYPVSWLGDLLRRLNRYNGKFLSDGRIVVRTEAKDSAVPGRMRMTRFTFLKKARRLTMITCSYHCNKHLAQIMQNTEKCVLSVIAAPRPCGRIFSKGSHGRFLELTMWIFSQELNMLSCPCPPHLFFFPFSPMHLPVQNFYLCFNIKVSWA